MKKLLLLTLCVAFFGLVGCETIQGAGKDIQRAGQALENAVD